MFIVMMVSVCLGVGGVEGGGGADSQWPMLI